MLGDDLLPEKTGSAEEPSATTVVASPESAVEPAEDTESEGPAEDEEPSAPAPPARGAGSADASGSEPEGPAEDEEPSAPAPPEEAVAESPAEPEAPEGSPEEAVAQDAGGVRAADEGEPSGAPAPAPPPAEDEDVVSVTGSDPFAGPGDWYVIHTYAGYENKVRANLESRIQTMQMQDKIFDVVIPMEDVMEIKGGRKQVVQKKVFPGYLLVKMVYDNDSWYVVRNTPGVTGFVSSGTGQKPTPLPRREVEKFLLTKKEVAKPTFRLEFEEGDVVRIISGPFADFNGTINEINVDQSKVKVMVNIFDRETPVELSFDQVARV